MVRKLCFILVFVLPALYMSAQNITDLAVMNDRSADSPVTDVEGTSVDDSVFLHPDRIRYDRHCFQIEGKDVFLYSGTFHYFRTPQPLWHDRMTKLKSAGFNCVETYIPWNWHERGMPRSLQDESQLDMQPLEDFLSLAEDLGLYVIVRPGPYICAEWSGGGFPQWLMRKKPENPKFDTWLQSTDPEFMRWNEHWYKAVCRTVAPYQITRKPKGGTGVILFQIENEFNRIKWFPRSEKRRYLEDLARMVRRYDIDVPLITCWTDEARNVKEGPLNGVLDMVNSYPRWNVEQNFGRLINQQLKTQPGKPLLSGELQGGWMSEVGARLSWEQDGLTPAQTQNITLYALQRGFCGLNYYMAVGGTNLDDWGARQMTTTYDYAAAIGENGATNERYRRMRGLAPFLKEHGTKIARARIVQENYHSTDADVKMLLRQTENGDRYYFIRTEEYTRHHFGTLETGDLTLDFALEPFGSMVYYLPAGAEQGEWYPRLPQPEVRPSVCADTLRIDFTESIPDVLPQRWTKLKRGEFADHKGVYDRHYIYYRTQAKAGKELRIERIGKGQINGTDADEVLVSVDGSLLPISSEDKTSVCYRLPDDSLSGRKIEVLMLFESKGLHHHTKKEVEDYWFIGPYGVSQDGKPLALEFASTERERGIALSDGRSYEKTKGKNPLLCWSVGRFTLSRQAEGVRYPWHLHIEHAGNGFLYLNGHCIGRLWQNGPQRDYYLPECWLNFGGENVIAVSLRPVDGQSGVSRAELIPGTWAAEYVKFNN